MVPSFSSKQKGRYTVPVIATPVTGTNKKTHFSPKT
jgi:hypothetical protein